ncbi:unnamed protein product [Ostreobium quekettii]|uniref:Uncharacterized protein n=1 Tax=Ostreobium quekettii TaxID=121088 RepID=A0A8S1IKQ3_9CHLO|nr:unnamed protein product [Ostreobium quekettii]|eukprot:evm.model.scf_9.7 EVM.evm.TU.scf_9.7   scf_9:120046-126235(-)
MLRKVKSSEGSLSGLAFGSNWVPAFGKLRKSASSGTSLNRRAEPDDDIWGQAEAELTLEPNLCPKALPFEQPPTSPRVLLHSGGSARRGNEVRAVYTLIGAEGGSTDRVPPKAAGTSGESHLAAARSRQPLDSILESPSPRLSEACRCDIMRSAPELTPKALCEALAINMPTRDGDRRAPAGGGMRNPRNVDPPPPTNRTKINLEMREMPRSLRKALMMSEPVSDHFSDATAEDWTVSEEGEGDWGLCAVGSVSGASTSESSEAPQKGELQTVLVHADVGQHGRDVGQYSGELGDGDSLAGMSMSRDADRPFPEDDLSSEFAFPQTFAFLQSFAAAYTTGMSQAGGQANGVVDSSPFYGLDGAGQANQAMDSTPFYGHNGAEAGQAGRAMDAAPFYGSSDAGQASRVTDPSPVYGWAENGGGIGELKAAHAAKEEHFDSQGIHGPAEEGVREDGFPVVARSNGGDGRYGSEGEEGEYDEDGELLFELVGVQDDDELDVQDVFLPEADDVTYAEEGQGHLDACQRPQVFPPEEEDYELSSEEERLDNCPTMMRGPREGRVQTGGDDEFNYHSKPLKGEVYESDRCRGSFDSDDGPVVDTAFDSARPAWRKMGRKRVGHSRDNNGNGCMYDTAHTIAESDSSNGPQQAAWMWESRSNEFVETLPSRCTPSPTTVYERHVPMTSSADIWLEAASQYYSTERYNGTGKVKCFDPSAMIGAIIRRLTGRCSSRREANSPEPSSMPRLDLTTTGGSSSEGDATRRSTHRYAKRQSTMLQVVEERLEDSDLRDRPSRRTFSDAHDRSYRRPAVRQAAQPATARSVNKSGAFHGDARFANRHAYKDRSHGCGFSSPGGSGSEIQSCPDIGDNCDVPRHESIWRSGGIRAYQQPRAPAERDAGRWF